MVWAPLIGGLIGAAGTIGAAGIGAASNGAKMSEEERAKQEMLARLDAINLPKYGKEEYRTDVYNPNKYETPEDAQYQLASVDPRMRESQMAALQSLQDRYNGVADAQMNADSYKAMNQGQQMAQGRQGAIAQNAAMRGVGGGGLEFAMQQQAAQDEANRAQAGTLQAAQMAAMQKLAGQNAYMQGLGGLRNQDFDQERYNSDVINRFNLHNTDARNKVGTANTEMGNNTQMFNIGSAASDRGKNIDRGDRNQNAGFDAAYKKAGGQNQVETGALARQGAGMDTNAALAGSALQAGTNLAGSVMANWPQDKPTQPQGYMSDEEYKRKNWLQP